MHFAWVRRSRTRQDQALGWRLLVPLVLLGTGALFITSGVNADGTDLRAGRYTDLGSLLKEQKQETDARRAEAAALADEVNRLSQRVGDNSARQVQEKAQALRGPVGLVPVEGPGLTITLDDAPDEVIAAAPEGVDLNRYVVHQQDIQAVVNAMWAGGAEAMTIQNQRIISTTGIKCVGNTVRLHGVPYSPPYVITAVGDPETMLTSVNDSPYVQIYQQYVQSEDYQLGYDVEVVSDVRLPGYEGSLDLDYARPAGEDASRPDDSDI